MGGYEPDPQSWTLHDVPEDFEFQLFADDWDHFEQHMARALARQDEEFTQATTRGLFVAARARHVALPSFG